MASLTESGLFPHVHSSSIWYFGLLTSPHCFQIIEALVCVGWPEQAGDWFQTDKGGQKNKCNQTLHYHCHPSPPSSSSASSWASSSPSSALQWSSSSASSSSELARVSGKKKRMAASLSRQFLLVGLCHNLGLCHNPSLDTFEYNPHPEFTPMDGCTPAKSIGAQRENATERPMNAATVHTNLWMNSLGPVELWQKRGRVKNSQWTECDRKDYRAMHWYKHRWAHSRFINTTRIWHWGHWGWGRCNISSWAMFSEHTYHHIVTHTHTRALQICYIKCIHAIVSIVLWRWGKFCNKDQIYEILWAEKGFGSL